MDMLIDPVNLASSSPTELDTLETGHISKATTLLHCERENDSRYFVSVLDESNMIVLSLGIVDIDESV